MSDSDKKTIYLAGPMKGIANNNQAAFNKASDLLTDAGHEVINKAAWNHGPSYDFTAADGMQLGRELLCDLADIPECDGVALLPGWETSEIANCEYLFAECCGVTVKPLGQWLAVPTDRMTATEIIIREMEMDAWLVGFLSKIDKGNKRLAAAFAGLTGDHNNG